MTEPTRLISYLLVPVLLDGEVLREEGLSGSYFLTVGENIGRFSVLMSNFLIVQRKDNFTTVNTLKRIDRSTFLEKLQHNSASD